MFKKRVDIHELIANSMQPSGHNTTFTSSDLPKTELAIIRETNNKEEDEEEDPVIWEPDENSIENTIKSLSYFRNFEINGEESDRSEIKESFKNFDQWLLDTISLIVSEERAKEDKLFM